VDLRNDPAVTEVRRIGGADRRDVHRVRVHRHASTTMTRDEFNLAISRYGTGRVAMYGETATAAAAAATARTPVKIFAEVETV